MNIMVKYSEVRACRKCGTLFSRITEGKVLRKCPKCDTFEIEPLEFG